MMGKALSKVEFNRIKGRWDSLLQEYKFFDSSDVQKIVDHIEVLEELLDETDSEDFFGTEGWRHRLGID